MLAEPSLDRAIRAATKQRVSASRLYVLAGALAALIIALIVLLMAQRSRLARMVADQLPISWEQQFGEAVFQQMQSRLTIVDDPTWTSPLSAVSARLLPVVTNSGYHFKFHLVQENDINAFAIPGGHIVVHLGLIKAVKQPEELAGVLAHELAHITQRHSLRNLVEAAGLAVLIRAILGDTSGLLAGATDGTEALLRQKFSRDFEREADDLAWTYLTAARIDPRGMIRFFRTLQAAQEKNAPGAEGRLNFLSSHPATAERIKRLEAKWDALTDPGGFLPLDTKTPSNLGSPAAAP